MTEQKVKRKQIKNKQHPGFTSGRPPNYNWPACGLRTVEVLGAVVAITLGELR